MLTRVLMKPNTRLQNALASSKVLTYCCWIGNTPGPITCQIHERATQNDPKLSDHLERNPAAKTDNIVWKLNQAIRLFHSAEVHLKSILMTKQIKVFLMFWWQKCLTRSCFALISVIWRVFFTEAPGSLWVGVSRCRVAPLALQRSFKKRAHVGLGQFCFFFMFTTY